MDAEIEKIKKELEIKYLENKTKTIIDELNSAKSTVDFSKTVINVLTGLITVVVALAGVLGVKTYFDLKNIKEDIEGYTKQKIQEQVNEIEESRISSNIRYYLKNKMYSTDINNNILTIFKNGKPFSNQNLKIFVNHAQSKLDELKNIKKDNELAIEIVNTFDILSQQEDNKIIRNFFDDFLDSNIDFKKHTTKEVYPHAHIMHFAAQDLKKHLDLALRLLSIQKESDGYYRSVFRLGRAELNKRLMERVFNLIERQNSIITSFQNNLSFLEFLESEGFLKELLSRNNYKVKYNLIAFLDDSENKVLYSISKSSLLGVKLMARLDIKNSFPDAK